MIISIASGKGGTGKTTVSTNLALSLRNVQFIDCDVEEPNANIFIKAKIRENESVNVEIPEIDNKKCDFCGKCSKFCAYNAIAVVSSSILVFPELCHSCGGCKLVCPKDAISWKEKTIGKIEHGKTKDVDFYHGLLNVGEMQAIPVIKALKRKLNGSKNVILDVPPGTSCPVIESISGSDFCILVTEPTPFGLYDLKLAVKVVRYFEIPFGVVINRDGIGDKKAEEFCKNQNIPILLKIPERKKIAQLYSNGIALVNESYEWQEMFKDVFNKISNEVKASSS
jgi:MinD superfamily P-loop ATPase